MFATIGSWSARHRRWVLAAWAVLFALGIVIGGQVFSYLKDSPGSSTAESVHGLNLLDAARASGPDAVAVIDGRPVDDPGTRAAVQQAARTVGAVAGVSGVVTAYDSTDPHLRSRDGRASLMVITLRKADAMVEHGRVDAIRAALHGSVPGATVEVGGGVAVSRDSMHAVSEDLVRGELISLPILLIALVFVFRGVRVALIPLAGALVTVAGALLLLRGMTTVTDVGSYSVDVVVLFGLALAVDYSLLMVSRFREQRAADGAADAIAIATRTTAAAGRTITFSAATVIAALAGLFAFGDPTFTGLAIGGIATVLVALVAGLTLIPALLTTSARHLGRMPRTVAGDGFFGRLARRVQRRPLLVAVLTTAVLVAAALPFLSLHVGNGDPRTLPRSAESRQVAERLLAGFPGADADPVVVVAPVPASDPAVAAYAQQLAGLPGVAAVSVEHGLRGDVTAIDVVPAGSVQGAAAQSLVTQLRADRPVFPTYVSGQEANLIDFEHQIADRLPYALAIIALTTFVLLFLMTGSVLVPVKALVMNTLSLGATFGALVWIFQEGHLSGLLQFDAFGAVEVWVPVIVFVFAFGLSMDYEVFLLSRIKECYDECGDSDHAVAEGLQRSGRIITSAAALVIIVFLGFAAGQSLGIKEMGLALAIAVLVDATLVRCLLVPATMTLLGNANWWAPRPLRRLHDRFGVREVPHAADGVRIPAPRSPVGVASSDVPAAVDRPPGS